VDLDERKIDFELIETLGSSRKRSGKKSPKKEFSPEKGTTKKLGGRKQNGGKRKSKPRD